MRTRRSRRSRRSQEQLPDTHLLQCLHCHQEYVPIKRGTQKFCSSSCRSTHSKQKKAGTLGKLTSLPGPARGGLSFLETVTAAGLGAATANAGEYLLVTRHLVAQSERQHQQLTALTDLVHHQHRQQNQLLEQVHQLSQALTVALQALGVDAARIETLLPGPEPVSQVPPSAALPEMSLPPEPDHATDQAFYEQLVAAMAAAPEPAAPSVRSRPAKP